MGLSGQFRTGWPGQMDFLRSPTWKRELHYNCHHRVGMRTDGLPSIWQDHTWLCLQLLLFAIIVLSILHLLVPFILHNYSMRERLLFSISQIGNWNREVKRLSKVTPLLSRICTELQNLASYSVFLTPTRCRRRGLGMQTGIMAHSHLFNKGQDLLS